MKVLMFGWEFPPHISGGLGTACYGLTKALSEFDDIELSFVVPKIWGDEDQTNCVLIGAGQVPVLHDQIQFADTSSKVEYYGLRSELVPYLGSGEFYELKSKGISEENQLVEITGDGKFIFGGDYGPNLFQEVRNFAVVAEALSREIEFDVIHVHDWMTFPAGIAAKHISGKPLVVHLHSTEFDRSGLQVNPAICAIEKEGMDHADKIITVSNYTREILIRNYHILPEKITTVYNAAEPTSAKIEKELIPISNEKIVSFLGRITMQKGPEYFVDAASMVLQKMKNVRFVMAGKGDLRQAMINRAAELNISGSFDFPGFLSDEEVARLFSRSDLFVMPSVSEPFGIVALEAIQANVPIVISKQSGVSEVLNHVVKVDYWDVIGLADAIYYLVNDQIFASNLVAQSKSEVDKLLWKNSASLVRDLYSSLLVEI
jgi:glycosyltransferase involved in cell wall biosynthesis